MSFRKKPKRSYKDPSFLASVTIRLTYEQKQFLVKMAKKYKQPLSAYLRDWMFTDMYDSDDPPFFD